MLSQVRSLEVSTVHLDLYLPEVVVGSLRHWQEPFVWVLEASWVNAEGFEVVMLERNYR